MKAIVVEKPGTADVLQIRNWPKPKAKEGWALIQVKAFGLNRSEMFTRQGHSGDAVPFPRVLGIEAVGVVEAAPGTDLQPGQMVTAVMGGMGRAYDGSYAEYTLVPASQVMPLQTHLPWTTLAAIPETFITAWGALAATNVQPGQTLLIRGGTSSVGMAAASLAKDREITVVATTRNEAKATALTENGVDHVVIETGEIATVVRQIIPDGVDGVIELIGTKTLLDSLRCARTKGVVCFTGILGNEWALPNFEPFLAIPPFVRLTTYTSEIVTAVNSGAALQNIVDGVADGRFQVNIDRIFQFDEIVEAHQYMEQNKAKGKLVVVVDE